MKNTEYNKQSLFPIRVFNIKSVENELNRRKSYFPNMVHNTEFLNKSFIISSYSVEDYVKKIQERNEYNHNEYKKYLLTKLKKFGIGAYNRIYEQ
jgi:hypothetical protein